MPERESVTVRADFVVARRSAARALARRSAKASEPEFAYARLGESEVVTNLVTHRLDDLPP